MTRYRKPSVLFTDESSYPHLRIVDMTRTEGCRSVTFTLEELYACDSMGVARWREWPISVEIAPEVVAHHKKRLLQLVHSMSKRLRRRRRSK